MQLRVFMLGLGAALVAGTIWFAATAEDGKGFVQQASAQPPEAAEQEPAQSTAAAPAPRDVETEPVIIDGIPVYLVRKWRAERGEKYDSSNPESEMRAYKAMLAGEMERLEVLTAKMVRETERARIAMLRMELYCKRPGFLADVKKVASQHPNWSRRDASCEVFNHYYRQFYDGAVVLQRYRQPDAARAPDYRPKFKVIPDSPTGFSTGFRLGRRDTK